MNARLTKGRHIVDGDDATGAYRYEIVTETGEVTGQWSPPVNKPKPPRAKGNGQARCLSLEKFIRHTEIIGGCCGNEQAEVWGCKSFGECTLSETVPSVPACCNGCGRKITERSSLNPIILASHLAPGDTVVMTAAVRDLVTANPGEYDIMIASNFPELWENNPYCHHVTTNESDAELDARRYIDLHYPLVNRSDELPYHFIHGYRKDLQSKLGVAIPQGPFHGDIHLSDEEKGWVNQVEEVFGWKGPFWLIVSGGKEDFSAKWPNPTVMQEVVDHYRGKIMFVQVGDSAGDHHHPDLNGVFDLRGKTSLREMVRLMYHASGVVCPVTFAMHLAAAVPRKTDRIKPCIVLAGGRESPHWEQYPGHTFLHTLGALSCCETGGCWKSKCEPFGDDESKCELPVPHESGVLIPKCQMMITAQHVINAMELSSGNHW